MKIAKRVAPATTQGTLREVTRAVRHAVQRMLWGVAAGRCEFAGCNKPLWRSSVTYESVNIAEKAHIYAFSPDGPRGNRGIARKLLNSIHNLMLVCHECHRKMDKDKDGGRYTVAVLQEMKTSHERRIEIVTGIRPSKKSHILLYGANIGQHSSPLNFQDAAMAVFPDMYPAADRAIELGMLNSSIRDRDDAFWKVEAQNLRDHATRRVGERLAIGEITHLSVFALAPQPLLVLLGAMLTDIPRANVFQLHREPPGWAWPKNVRQTPAFEVHEPASTSGAPALVLALSATVTHDRIAAVLGATASVWMVTTSSPHNDFTKSRAQLAAFRTMMRPLLDRIKARHGQKTPLHIFPAASVSIAVELGRVRQPKADMPWVIYDQVSERGGFVEALSLP